MKKDCKHKWKLFPMRYFSMERNTPDAVQAVCEKCLKSYLVKPNSMPVKG